MTRLAWTTGEQQAERYDLSKQVSRIEYLPDDKMLRDWARAPYDRALVNFLSRYTKKWGARVGTTELSTTNPGSLRYEIIAPTGNVHDAFRNKAVADEAVRGYQESHRGPGKWTVRDNGTTERVHSIDITPQMRKSVLRGQPIAENTPELLDWRSNATGLSA
jgi:hypothetical protein